MAYKVVLSTNGARRGRTRLLSCTAEGRLCIEYIPGEWVEAPKMMIGLDQNLCVFGTIADAIRFGSRGSYLYRNQLWECECIGLTEPATYIDPEICTTGVRDFAKEVISTRESGKNNNFWPVGTLMARKVKLIKRINVEEYLANAGEM